MTLAITSWKKHFLLRFLGSMNLAIMLLVCVAIASVIGTILQQNNTYQDYIIKFGPFWHHVYKNLGLYDVYSSLWFLFILAFLVVSVSICISRNMTQILHSMHTFKLDMQKQALLNMAEHIQWRVNSSPGILEKVLGIYLRNNHYRIKSSQSGNQIAIAGIKGASNRLGYLLTHSAIVIICVGGLIDSNLALKLGTLTDSVKIETRDIPVSRLSKDSILDVDNPSFRASVSIPEGESSNYAFINIANGYLLQPLPFRILVKDFRIEQYINGQPKSFESDLVIYQDNRKVHEETIYVNHPLYYEGYTIYQSSFSDGGSSLDINLRILTDPGASQFRLKGVVEENIEFNMPDDNVTIEFIDFRPFNIVPIDDSSNQKFKDHGPKFTYKIRAVDGSAKEYENFMYPITIENADYFLSGVRTSPNENFNYLYIPVDNEYSINRFMQFQAALYNDELINTIISSVVDSSLSDKDIVENFSHSELGMAIQKLVQVFRSQGFIAISDYVKQSIPEAHQENAARAYINVLKHVLMNVYLTILEKEGILVKDITEQDRVFFDNALIALTSMKEYGAPFYLELLDFKHRQASGLQITHAPGKYLVYFGCGILIIGVFLLFYIAHQRIWLIIEKHGELASVTLAGVRTRHRKEFSREFKQLSDTLHDKFKQAGMLD